MSIKYSVVIPLKDEEENIELLVNELSPVMRGLGDSWELLCVDDGSSDKTVEKLRHLQIAHQELKILAFDKNYGQSSAFDAGFRNAQGEFVITMDGDLQNDPNDIPALVKQAARHDMVCGYRHNRKDPPPKKNNILLCQQNPRKALRRPHERHWLFAEGVPQKLLK